MTTEKIFEFLKGHASEAGTFAIGFLLGTLSCYRKIHKGIDKFLNGK